MRRTALSTLIAIAAVFGLSGLAEAQVKNRWKLGWRNEKPALFVYRAPDDKVAAYWYVIYEVTNDTDETIPLLLDIMLYVETGKELQFDVKKVDMETVKTLEENQKKAEPLKFGRFHSSVLYPEVEFKIIAYHAGIGNRSDGIIDESIKAMKKGFDDEPAHDKYDLQKLGKWSKGDRWYLNPREMREQRFIRPGQKLTGIAIYKDVDPRAKTLELQVSGLVDIIKVDQVDETEVKISYENHVLKTRYSFPGDEYHREQDFLRFESKEWQIKKIGPVADKKTLDTLVNMLVDTLRREQDWDELKKTPEEKAQMRKKLAIDITDLKIAAHVIKLATGKDFGYDATKEFIENAQAIWRTHEWWLTNKTKLGFNEVTNRFEVKEDTLPGTVKDK